MIAKPVVVGLGHDTHLALSADTLAQGKTYCGRRWTADVAPGALITCLACRKAYASGRHPECQDIYDGPDAGHGPYDGPDAL